MSLYLQNKKSVKTPVFAFGASARTHTVWLIPNIGRKNYLKFLNDFKYYKIVKITLKTIKKIKSYYSKNSKPSLKLL